MGRFCGAGVLPSSLVRGCAYICLALLVGCSGGGGGGDDLEPSTNGCSALGLQARIINGTQCSESRSPVVQLLIRDNSGSTSLCSGTVITPQHILSAAHCFISGFGGASSVSSVTVAADGEQFDVARITVHPGATLTESSFINDVAIISLRANTRLPAVPILAGEPIESGALITIFGFGLDENGGLQTLRSGEMRISDVTQNHLIAPYEGQGSNTCNGDSGGPALHSVERNGASRSALIGVTSTGSSPTCGEGDVSLFANLQSEEILSFILDVAPGVELI